MPDSIETTEQVVFFYYLRYYKKYFSYRILQIVFQSMLM
jgi:hypothetical protein